MILKFLKAIWKKGRIWLAEKLELKPGAFLLPAFLLLVLPWQWVGAAALAAGIHEACHVLALKLTGGRVERITIGGSGAVIQTAPMDATRECICAFAGPLGSGLLLLFFRQLPRTALCALVHCLYNLLPLFPLDGGRVLRSLLSVTLPPDKASTVERWIQRGAAGLVLGGFFLVAWQYGAVTLLLGIWVILGHRMKNSLPIRQFGDTMEEVLKKEYVYDRIAATDPPHRAKTRTVYRRRV